MYNLITLITLAATVLQIVLFFKIWKMTNDVAEIKRQTASQNRPHTELIIGTPEEQKRDLAESFMAEVEANIRDITRSPEYRQRQVEVLAQKYNEVARKVGVDIDFIQLSKGLYDKTLTMLGLG